MASGPLAGAARTAAVRPVLPPAAPRRTRVLSAALLGVALGLGGAAAAPAEECVAIEDFSRGSIGELPPGWRLRAEEARGVYALHEEGGRRFLRASSRGQGTQAGKEHTWDLDRHPVLAWSWRPLLFPEGADERAAGTNDSALAVYVVFPHATARVQSVKYVWSAVVPPGIVLSTRMGLTRTRVLRSGTAGRGRWREERIDLRDDVRRLVGAAELPRPSGIAVLTDSDDTRSAAQGDYASFRACAG